MADGELRYLQIPTTDVGVRGHELERRRLIVDLAQEPARVRPAPAPQRSALTHSRGPQARGGEPSAAAWVGGGSVTASLT